MVDRRFGETGFSPALGALWGVDYRDKPYVDTSLPWVTAGRTEEEPNVEVDPNIAAEYGVSIYEDPSNPGSVIIEEVG